MGCLPRLERSPGEGNGNPLKSSCLEHPTDRKALQAPVHGVSRESNTTYWLNSSTFLDALTESALKVQSSKCSRKFRFVFFNHSPPSPFSLGTSLTVHRSRLCPSDTRGVGLISAQGTKIPHTVDCSQKNNPFGLHSDWIKATATLLDIVKAVTTFRGWIISPQKALSLYPRNQHLWTWPYLGTKSLQIIKLRSWTPNFLNCEMINFFCLSHSVCCILFLQTQLIHQAPDIKTGLVIYYCVTLLSQIQLLNSTHIQYLTVSVK